MVSRASMGLSPAAQEPAPAQAGGNLLACWGATRTTPSALALSGGHYSEAVVLTSQRVITNIGIIRDPVAEPWIIAIACPVGLREPLVRGLDPRATDLIRGAGRGGQAGVSDHPRPAPGQAWATPRPFDKLSPSTGSGGHRTHVLRLQGRGSALDRPICAIPTVSSPELVEELILVMSLALYWAVSTGMWDQVSSPTPAEKTTKLSACQTRSQQALLVHARNPPRPQTPSRMHPTLEALGIPTKLIDDQSITDTHLKKI
jgi:hypothetical protein